MFAKHILISCLFLYTFSFVNSSVCNEVVCASVVSKCMLTQSCKCDLTHCSCCKDCFSCLSYLFDECCSCVDMCPGSEFENSRKKEPYTLSKDFYTEKLEDGGVPSLFAMYASDPDHLERWYTVSIPDTISDVSLQSVEDDVSKKTVSGNCSVVYKTSHISMPKCKSFCESIGSYAFRWFNVGCCGCIGENCKNYGSVENKCLFYPGTYEEDMSEDNLNYGEETDTLEYESI